MASALFKSYANTITIIVIVISLLALAVDATIQLSPAFVFAPSVSTSASIGARTSNSMFALPRYGYARRTRTLNNRSHSRTGFMLRVPSKRNSNDEEQSGHEDDDEARPADESQPETVFYDDFDFMPGTSNNDNDSVESEPGTGVNSRSSQLSLLLQQTLQEETLRNTRITQNWTNGNWKCRGFSLDKANPLPGLVDSSESDSQQYENKIESKENAQTRAGATGTTRHDTPIQVSQIAFDETALGPGFGTTAETVAVGRTDGTVYIIELGSEYLTKFHAVPKLTMGGSWEDGNENRSGDDNGPSVRVEMEMISDTELNERNAMSSGLEDLDLSASSTPFEIQCQFQAHGKDEPISALLFHDDTLFTAAKKSGVIKVWKINDADTNFIMVPVQNLDVHQDDVVVLKTLSSSSSADTSRGSDVSDHNLLLSASLDGSFALWDMMSGDLVYRCELTDDDGNPTSITAADVDTSGDEHIIYLSLSSGEW